MGILVTLLWDTRKHESLFIFYVLHGNVMGHVMYLLGELQQALYQPGQYGIGCD